MNFYQRLFGSGPLGLLASLGLVALAWWAERAFPAGGLGLPRLLRYIVLGAASLLTLAGVVWSFRSLPAEARGRHLCVQGAFRWVRHPLYASFLSIFCPAVALYLNHWFYLLWAVLLHPLWHILIRYEESMMVSLFGEEYIAYCHRTGRFIPRWRRPR